MDIQSRKNSILKAFDTDLEKARSGVYADTSQNRKLGRVGQKYGGKKDSGDDKVMQHDLDTIAATGTKKQLYDAVNKKYGTDFKVGDIDEFEDDAFRKELKVKDIKAIVDDETDNKAGDSDFYEKHFKGNNPAQVKESLKTATDKELAKFVEHSYELGSAHTSDSGKWIAMHNLASQEVNRRKKGRS